MLLGRHVSRSSLVKEATRYNINAVQVFTKPPTQWYGTDLPAFRPNYNGVYVCAHAGYLINLANTASQSAKALLHEAERCKILGIPDLVVHPGSGKIADVIRSLNSIAFEWPAGVRLLLENTAGQGNYIGGPLNELEEIISIVNAHMPVRICFDTAHAHEYGLNILEYVCNPLVKVIHLNDSLTPFGSRKDRHANLGRGTIPVQVFQHLASIKDIPLIMETPEAGAMEDFKYFRSLTHS